MSLRNVVRGALVSGAFGLGLSLSACGGGGGKTVDAEDWVSDFCDAAIDYQENSDDVAVDFLDIDLGDDGAKSDVLKVLAALQKEQDAFKKAAAKVGTPDLDSGKEVRQAVDDEFKDRADDLKKTIAAIKKLDEGRRFEAGVEDAFNEGGTGEFRDRMDKIASKRATRDAQEIIDLIDEDSGCSSVAFSD